MARALKARDLSGLGNTVWRRVMWAYNAFRQIRNPDETGMVFPTQGEFFEIYQHLDPENDPARFPATSPGEPEGLNLANIINAFVFGGSNFYAEQFRMGDGTVPLWIGALPPSTPEEFWELAKAQRGVIDPEDGVQNVPALQAAQSGSITAGGSLTNPQGKAWGGAFPRPVEISSCGAGEWAEVPNFELFFTALKDDVSTAGLHGTVSTNGDGRKVVTYAGSCPVTSDVATDGHVQFIARTSKYYVVFVLIGSDVLLDFFPKADWLEGPYTGNARLFRYDGGHISRALWAFAQSFRGTTTQRTPDDFDIGELAFDFQTFFGEQYHLAPNLGTFNGVGIEANYPTAKVSAEAGATIPAGTMLSFMRGRQAHEYREGFVLTGFFAKATNLFAPVTLEVLSDKKVIGRMVLEPGESAIKYLTSAVTPAPLRVRLASKAKFTAAGSITFEANELLEYKPDHWDAYLLLRLAATRGGFEGEGRFLDGSGVDETESKRIFEDYANFGCVLNTVAAGVRSIEAHISENPIYDAMRRLTRSFSRIVQRRQFRSYEVSEGKAILRFSRWAYGLKNQKADYFHGIAPSWRGVTEVVEGEEYIVRSHTGGTITYGGRKFGHQKRFIGAKETKTFEAHGDAVLLEYEGIKPVARKKGWTNEWCMFMNFHPYHPSDSSLWKLDSYGDYFTWNNRALMFNPSGSAQSNALKRLATIYQATYSSVWHSPEAPDTYNYYGGINSSADPDFCASNPIFRAPYELESATVEFDADGEDVVKLVFKAKFQTHADAPATVSADPGTWSGGQLTALAGEDYRTDDNALRQYAALFHLNIQSYWKNGDDAFSSPLQGFPDNPFACCIPHFFFAKLPEEPYADGNDKLDDDDTRVTIDNFLWWEIWLKAGCEGFVNSISTQAFICEQGFGQPYDYLFEDLTYDANQKRFIGDFEAGHGPSANTIPLASLYNEFANCINLLNKVQIHGLFQFQARTLTYEGESAASPTWVGTGGANCPPGASGGFYVDGCAPGGSLVSTGAWAGAIGLSASASAGTGQCGPGGEPVGLFQTRLDVEYRYTPVTGLDNAIPDSIKDLMAIGSASVWGNVTRTQSTSRIEITDNLTLTGCITGNGAFNIDEFTGYIFPETETITEEPCVELTSGAVSVGSAPCGVFAGCSQVSEGQIVQVSKAVTALTYSFEKLMDAESAIVIVPLVDVEVES